MEATEHLLLLVEFRPLIAEVVAVVVYQPLVVEVLVLEVLEAAVMVMPIALDQGLPGLLIVEAVAVVAVIQALMS
jgi:hypothetical protein